MMKKNRAPKSNTETLLKDYSLEAVFRGRGDGFSLINWNLQEPVTRALGGSAALALGEVRQLWRPLLCPVDCNISGCRAQLGGLFFLMVGSSVVDSTRCDLFGMPSTPQARASLR